MVHVFLSWAEVSVLRGLRLTLGALFMTRVEARSANQTVLYLGPNRFCDDAHVWGIFLTRATSIGSSIFYKEVVWSFCGAQTCASGGPRIVGQWAVASGR